MRRADRFRYFLDYFTINFPEPKTELAYRNPYELIVAVVLSAQCTDKRVNLVMPALLAEFPTAAHLGAGKEGDFAPDRAPLQSENARQNSAEPTGCFLQSSCPDYRHD